MTDELLLLNSNSCIATESESGNGDRVLTFNYNPNHNTGYARGRLQSANSMLNSSTLEPKVAFFAVPSDNVVISFHRIEIDTNHYVNFRRN